MMLQKIKIKRCSEKITNCEQSGLTPTSDCLSNHVENASGEAGVLLHHISYLMLCNKLP